MISVKKSNNDKPAILNNVSIADKLDKISTETEPGKKVNSLYNHDSVRLKLNQLYHNKCAYCEGKIPEGYKERIDHYRPKNKVKTIFRKKNSVVKSTKKLSNRIKIPNHKGYFWLGFEWTNLLPSCEKCNSRKSNLFPIDNENDRISDKLIEEGFLMSDNETFIFDEFQATSNTLQRENRLLLNPELDEIEKHFIFLPTGEIEALTEEGEMSIEVYGLNRGTLILARRKIVDDYIAEIIKICNEHNADENVFRYFIEKDLKNPKNNDFSTNEYASFRRFLFDFYEEFVLEKVGNLFK